MNMRQQIIAVSDAWCAATGRSRATLSTILLNKGPRLDQIAAGQADLVTGTFERAMQWFSDEWPKGATWPQGVARPAPRAIEAAQ